jgi:hypothetical protein
MPSELVRLPAGKVLTPRERVSVELLLDACVKSLQRRLPADLELVALDIELERVDENAGLLADLHSCGTSRRSGDAGDS